MKKRFNNTIDASKRKALKGLALLGSALFLSHPLFSVFEETRPVHFVGLGKGGSSAVKFFHKQGIKGKFTCVSHPDSLNLPEGIQLVPFIPPSKSHFQIGAEVYRVSDMEQKIEIPLPVWNIFKSNDKFVILSGLGGFTGTFMTEEITWWLHGSERPFRCISSMPFRFEGKKKKQLAQSSIDRLQDVANFSYHDLEITRLMYRNLSIKSTFEKANGLLYEMYKSSLKV